MKGTASAFVIRLFSIVAIVVFWHVAAIVFASDLLPTPLQVVMRILQVYEDGSLVHHLLVTLRRVVLSFVVAMIIGTAIGMVMGNKQTIDLLLDGLLILGLNIPALVVIILCYIWFGLTEAAAVIAVSINKIPMVVVTMREGARSIDRRLLDVSKVYQVSAIDTFRKVYMPQLYPFFFVAARNGLALIWKIVLVVELLGRSDGVGFQLGTFFQFFDIEGILAYTLAFVFIILVFEALVMRPLENYLARWRT